MGYQTKDNSSNHIRAEGGGERGRGKDQSSPAAAAAPAQMFVYFIVRLT